MGPSPLIPLIEDLRDLTTNSEISDPRLKSILLRYLEDFEDKLIGGLRREADRQHEDFRKQSAGA